MILAELFPYAQVIYTVFTIIYAFAILGVIGIVISENRNPIKSLAWVTVLILLPVVGLFLYLFFGRSLKSVVMISRKNRVKLRRQEKLENIDVNGLDLCDSSKQLIRLVNSVVEPHYFQGNSIDIFTEGVDKFKSLKRDLLAAEKYINFQYYIFSNDTIGQEIADILIAKAHQGVKVRVIYDHVGSWSIASSFFKRMRRDGVDAHPFLRVTFPQLANRLNWRNHRKVVIIDGKVGYIGGMNVADRYNTGAHGRPAWRDTHLRVVGGAVKALQYSFAVDWNFMKRMLLTQATCSYHTDPNAGNGVQVIDSGPTGLWNGMSLVFLKAISLAQKCIYIQTPYFLPNDGQIKALQAAALAGVDVRLMIPRSPDSRILRYSSFSYVKECLQAGIKVYFYTGRMLHAKCIIVDDEFVTTGSTNFDFRSFEHNFECNILVYGKAFNARMKQIYMADIRNSQRIILSHWKRRPMGQRALESLSRLLGPIL